MVTGKQFADFAAAQAGHWVYVWGGNGAEMSAMDNRTRNSWIAKQEGRLTSSSMTLEERIAADKALYASLCEAGVSPIFGGDCSGFVYWCLRELGVQKSDLSSRGLFSICKQVAEEELQPGDLLFKWTDTNNDGQFQKNEIVHVGFYLGDGRTVECIGRKSGVVINPLAGMGWQVFGRLKYFPDVPQESVAAESVVKTPAVKVLGGSVRVRDSGSILGKKLGTAHKGEVYPLQDWSGQGWYRIAFHGGIGYISNKVKYTQLTEV